MRKSIGNQFRGDFMQIVIPMSGFGERFRAAGYTIPKPLIEVEGKPIIQHVVEMFSNEDDFIFICNEDHLLNPEYKMKAILQDIALNSSIVSIKPHKLGPVYAVMQVLDEINLQKSTIVNYCDFTCYWNYGHFKNFAKRVKADGIIPSYRGFHPHTLWSNYYAYVKEDNYRASDIQEKQPFTNKPTNEFASSGTYYFKTGALMQEYFQRCIDEELLVSDEYYVSMVYKPMMQDNLKVYVYELQHFMQWGTPSDLNEYRYWSDIFRHISNKQELPKHDGTLLLPMAGLGSRFQKEGYKIQKPLIPVSGSPMAVQAMSDLPNTELQRYVVRKGIEGLSELIGVLTKLSKKSSFEILNHATDGQATTCIEGASGLNMDAPVTIAACDNGMIYDTNKFNDLMLDENVDIIVWGARGYPGAIRNPEMYGWINIDNATNEINHVSVKKPLDNPVDDLIIVGAFTFKKLKYFFDAVQRMKDRKGLVNGEYYVDTAINDAIALGYKCKIFEINHYICWGTPNDLKTFEYWQSCFHKWESHPYNLENDTNIPKTSVEELKDKYEHTTPRKHQVAS
jgi:NDP-sugar pyrophosphorylase family protein